MSTPLRILVVGGDPSLWVALSATLGETTSQIFVPPELEVSALKAGAKDIDIIVVVTSSDDPDPVAPLRKLREAGLARRTLVLAERDDQRTASESLATGVGAYMLRSADPDRIAMAITHIAEGGAFYDAPAAAALHGSRSFSDVGAGMSAARALASATELKDVNTGGHAERVTALAMRLARVVLLDDAMPSDALEAAFLLHDVGKIGIPESILNKPGGLTDTERRVLQTHPILGERIIAPLGLPQVVRDVVRHHHEKWDGTGYPDGLKGLEIPPAARVFAIADVVDAMTSIRPYRQPVSFEEAVHEIVLQSGKHFDPDLTPLAEGVFLSAPAELRVSTPPSRVAG